ncbi:MAG: SUMF1/EgtB/PvdO family nonheme iron enzyme [Bacteroidota bacterium]
MAGIEKTVFISYRRKDSAWALAVYQYLTNQKYDVFLDYESIPSGDFEQIIASNIKARAHFLLILTPTALDRCSEPGDWLRREIETAIDEKRNIIPLFFNDFSFGSPSVARKLTGKLVALKRYNGLDVPDGYFIEAMERLCERYLNVPLNAAIQPVSTEVRKAVQNAQIAADSAVMQKKDVIAELVKPAAEKEKAAEPEAIAAPEGDGRSTGKRFNTRFYGIGALILLLLVLGIAGITSLVQKNKPSQVQTPTSAPTQTQRPTIAPSETLEFPAPPLGVESTETPTPTLAGMSTVTYTATPGIGSTSISEKDQMTLLYVPEGPFIMGSADGVGQSDEHPQHRITLDAFWIDQTEITNAMYRNCVNDGKCKSPVPKSSATHNNYFTSLEYNDFPVIYVSWADAKNYCAWVGGRLPTEAEWEKAASWDEKNQQKLKYPMGDTIDCSLANYSGGKGCVYDTTQVGQYLKGASPYGVLDMAGNVWEWVADNYDPAYYQDPSSSKNPQKIVLNGKYYVARGGSWSDHDNDARTANRSQVLQTSRENNLGFRCVLPVNTPQP